MPTTIKAADHPARQWIGDTADSTESLLKESCPTEFKKCESVIRSSFGNLDTEPSLQPSRNGFVRAALAAYCNHHHLTLRPEDIWFAILTQLSLHINAHAEELRSFFVAHKGQKELWVYAAGNINTVDFGAMAQQMSKLMSTQVVDPELQTWIMPDFSTTTKNDEVVASIIMMGAMQKYFSYVFCLMCGIPSVTLLGVRADWEEMLHRLEKLPSLGPEPTQFYTLLKPILTRFVRSFDSPDSPETKDFWQKIADRRRLGSGSECLSGWITAFCFWDEDGKSLYAPNGYLPSEWDQGCLLEEIKYHCVEINKIPSGNSSVPVTVDDNGVEHKTIMVAGSMGIRVTSTGNALDDSRSHPPWDSNPPVKNQPPQGMPGPDSLQPESGWIMFEAAEELEVSEKPKGDKDSNDLAAGIVRRDRNVHGRQGILAYAKRLRILGGLGT